MSPRPAGRAGLGRGGRLRRRAVVARRRRRRLLGRNCGSAAAGGRRHASAARRARRVRRLRAPLLEVPLPRAPAQQRHRRRRLLGALRRAHASPAGERHLARRRARHPALSALLVDARSARSGRRHVPRGKRRGGQPTAPACSALEPKVGQLRTTDGGAAPTGTGTGNPYGGPPPDGGPEPRCTPDAPPDMATCDGCETARCCATRFGCYDDPGCFAVDEDFDACRHDAGAAGASACWNAFSASGAAASARVACQRASCKDVCKVP